MPSLLDEIWIFSKDGIPIIDFARIGGVDKSMLGSFISAIKTFVNEVSKGQLKSLNVGNDKYTFTTCVQDSTILVCKSPIEVKDKKIQKICRIIADIFDDMFSFEDISNWDGDVSFFDKFKDKIDLYFKMAEL
ncbi:MAG: hypothetical protein ACFE8E_06345 [Candidatus Hodarchaeota archaeon]